MTRLHWWALAGLAGTVAAAMLLAPEPSSAWRLPLSQRLLYLHVPMAWASYVAWCAVAATAVLHLAGRTTWAPRYLIASAEVGAPIAGIALVTGLVWAEEFVGYDAFRDPKLISTAVLFLWLASLVLLAATARPEAKHRLVAAFGLLGVATVPASYLASSISVHPDFARPGQGLADGTMWALLLVSTAAHIAAYAAWVHVRAGLERRQEALHAE